MLCFDAFFLCVLMKGALYVPLAFREGVAWGVEGVSLFSWTSETATACAWLALCLRPRL